MLVWALADLILRHKSKDWIFSPGCELFISLYPSSCYRQAPESVLQMGLSISLKSVATRKWPYPACTDVVWSARRDQKGRRGCLYTPTNPRLGRGWHKPFAHSRRALFCPLLHLLAESPPQDSSPPRALGTWSGAELQLLPRQLLALAGNGKQMMESYALLRSSALSALFFCRKGPFGHQL